MLQAVSYLSREVQRGRSEREGHQREEGRDGLGVREGLLIELDSPCGGIAEDILLQQRCEAEERRGRERTLMMAMVEGFSHSKSSCRVGVREVRKKEDLVALKGTGEHGTGVNIPEEVAERQSQIGQMAPGANLSPTELSSILEGMSGSSASTHSWKI